MFPVYAFARFLDELPKTWQAIYQDPAFEIKENSIT